MTGKRLIFLRGLQSPGRKPGSVSPWAVYVCLFVLVWICIVSAPVLAKVPSIALPSLSQEQDPLVQAKALYDRGQFRAAIQILEKAVDQYRSQNDGRRQAAALMNLGRLQLEIGKPEPALTTWQQATAVYVQLGDRLGEIRSRLNQAEALQARGYSLRAIEILSDLKRRLDPQPDSLEKAWVLRSLADVLQSVGQQLKESNEFVSSKQLLQQSLEIARRLKSPQDIHAALFSLGDVATAEINNSLRILSDRPTSRTLKELNNGIDAALGLYQQAIVAFPTPATTVKAQLNQLRLVFNSSQSLIPIVPDPKTQLTKFSAYILTLVPQVQAQLDDLPVSRSGVYARINFADTLLKLQQENDLRNQFMVSDTSFLASSLSNAAQILVEAVKQASTLEDKRAEAYARGTLGAVYEQNRQLTEAQSVTQQALLLAQANDAPEIAYQLQRQLGRIFKAQKGKDAEARAAYSAAVRTLGDFRRDLVAVNPDVQFDFRDSVEPVYREYVKLLLQPEPGAELSQSDLEQALQQIEALNLNELDNFFREACLQGQRVLLNQLVEQNPNTAFIYPIILSESQVRVIAGIPNQKQLRYHAIDLAETENVEQILSDLRQQAAAEGGVVRPPAKKVYDWLIAPFKADLEANNVDTLVFVLDGAFRDVPMAVLYSGQRYLVEDYAIAISPGLQLLAPKPIGQQRLNALTAGLIEVPKKFDFEPLQNVEKEFKLIQATGIPTQQPLLEADFTSQELARRINATSSNVVHLATHGEFGSLKKNTFILMADGRIGVDQFSDILRRREQAGQTAIELLVLSACKTAEGDNRATLGLAGIAIRAGARSTLASLWTVGDDSTAIVMGKFYQELTSPNMTKAKALQTAQRALLESVGYSAPAFWAPYVLVGNWL